MSARRPRKNRLFLASLKSVLKKELLHMARDPAALIFALLFPLIELLLVGYILDVNVRQVNTVVYDLSGTQESQQLIDQFISTNTFKISKRVFSDDELYEEIISGRAKIGIKIPVDYANHIVEGTTAAVQVLIDGTNASVTSEAINVSNRVALEASLKKILTNSDSRLPLETRSSVLYNPEIRASNFYLPGLLIWEMPSITILLVALSIAGERERGTMEQLTLTPINPLGLIIGKIIPYGVLAMVAFCLLLAAMYMLFDVPINGNPLLLLFLSIPFILSGLGLGLIVSSGAKTQMEAVQPAVLARVLPPFYFSGFIFPVETMPKFFQGFSRIIPDRYFMEVCRGLILRGANEGDLWYNGLILTIISIVILSLATLIYQKKFGAS